MRKSYALLVVVAVFIPLAIAVMTLMSIRPWVLDRGFYENLLDDEALYEAPLIGSIPDGFRNGLPDAFTPDLFGAEGDSSRSTERRAARNPHPRLSARAVLECDRGGIRLHRRQAQRPTTHYRHHADQASASG